MSKYVIPKNVNDPSIALKSYLRHQMPKSCLSKKISTSSVVIILLVLLIIILMIF